MKKITKISLIIVSMIAVGLFIRFVFFDKHESNVDTYKDILEGSPEMVSKLIRMKHQNTLKTLYGDIPLQICDDVSTPIMPCRIYAEMRSATPSGNVALVDFVYSFMGICIYSEVLSNIHDVLSLVGNSVEWDKYALNLCFDDM